MRITVTANDIYIGQACNELRCPLARALRRATGRTWQVLGPEAFSDDGDVTLPRAAQIFIQRFDAALHVEPFTFDLNLNIPEKGVTS